MARELIDPNEGLREYFGMLNQTLERNSKLRELNRDSSKLALVDDLSSYKFVDWIRREDISLIVDINGDVRRTTVYDHEKKIIIKRTYY